MSVATPAESPDADGAAALPSDDEVLALVRDSERILQEPLPGTSSSFALYLHELRRYPVLTPEREHQLAVHAARGNTDARDALLHHNLRFVVCVARKYAAHGVPLEDLVQEGNVGLLRAVTRFNPDRGVKFVSYAVHWISQQLRTALANQQRSVRLPVNRAAQLAKINRAASLFAKAHGRPASPQDLARLTDVSVPTVQALLEISQGEVSLDAPRGDDDSSLSLGERIGVANPFEQNVDRRCRDDVIATMLRRLRPRDGEVMRLWFGLEGRRDHTLEEIGGLLGITRERVRQIRDRALREMKAMEHVALLRDYWNISLDEA